MSSRLYLPPEVWGITLQNLRGWSSQDELIYLWTTVRHVCRQFREEVEEIFRTEHLPKTWLHVDTRFRFTKQQLISRPRPSGQPRFEFDFKLCFDGLKPKHPERAVFSFRQVIGMRTPTNCATRVLGNLRNEAGLGVEGPSSQSQSTSRLRTIEHCNGLFVVQVRGGLNDCVVTKLHIHMKNRELSLEWKELFGYFFREKRFAETIPNDAPISDCEADEESPAWIEKRAVPGGYEFVLAPRADDVFNQLKPSVQALAGSDRDRWWRSRHEANECQRRIQCLLNPVQTWTAITVGTSGEARLSLKSCRLRRKADHEIDIDDEGAVNRARIGWEEESKQVADAERSHEWNRNTMACDSCRETISACQTDGSNPCKSCVSNGTECEWSLAILNGHSSVLSPMLGGTMMSNHALQDYSMQLTLLEQQNKRRRLAVHQNPVMQVTSPPSIQPTALHDYQCQLMMLEQQNKQRLSLARQPMLMRFQPRPVDVPNSHNWPPIALLPPLQYAATQPAQQQAQRCIQQRIATQQWAMHSDQQKDFQMMALGGRDATAHASSKPPKAGPSDSLA